uniref:Sugar transporter SWEET1 n=1 Tax=Aureoumbra lagunensis TaxID=44058 RepID=A0A7S3NR04_9STRA|mmetsp:Transcript_5906/g.8715  ORF Transcript_5906/g.8715 Transcript_5906/m.8715 type:complete len:254 (+) Transcript_5906:35-796(+)
MMKIFVLILCSTSALNIPGITRNRAGINRKKPSSLHSSVANGGAEENKFATTIAPTIGVIVANGMFLSSLPAVLDARSIGSLGSLNPIPWAFIWANCVAWLHYSVIIKNKYAFFSNALGAFLGLFFVLTGMALGSPAQRSALEIIALSATSMHIIATLFTTFLLKSQKQRQLFTGYLANIILIIFYAAPLSTLADVLATKSAASIYAPLSIIAGVNSALWVIYGLAIKDFFLAIPNGAGLLLAIVQLSFKAIF